MFKKMHYCLTDLSVDSNDITALVSGEQKHYFHLWGLQKPLVAFATRDFFRPHSWKQCFFTLLSPHSNTTFPPHRLGSLLFVTTNSPPGFFRCCHLYIGRFFFKSRNLVSENHIFLEKNCEFVLIILFLKFSEAVSRSNGTFINRRPA
jgi:hypothetical protein